MSCVGDVRGRSLIELVIEMFVIITLAPVIVACIVQGITAITAIAIPWIAITLITIGVAACIAAVLAAHRGARMEPPPGGGVPLLPPVRRPAGTRGNGDGRRRRED